MSIAPDHVFPGHQVHIAGSGFTPREQIQIVAYPDARVIATVRVDARGELRTAYRTPATAHPGTIVIEATGWSSGRVENGALQIEGHPGHGAGNGAVIGWALASGGILLSVSALWIAGSTGLLPKLVAKAIVR
ncbi:hypothetical protein [Galbitalea soli]|uniref:IPT/TIG domain-containing protein n=1 Tax=Galbitalea soli TaxID=1268042 RepID=A0A7C9PMC7_9MICO|nr:hypothetical protein [Galbitalea soli]NEM90805.1 hypothetical protein [Galbitalea soli]NYJ31523.1 hypothetical protein [Galbitalea soli]